MTIETLILCLVAASPSVVAIIAIICAVCKLIKAFSETKQAVMNTKEYEELKMQLSVVHEENRKLKTQLKEVLTKMDKIVRTGE